jgi:uncharacterized protein YgbK (DUF1537 family)
LAQANVGKVQIKYCSTFDSTPAGNIGPSLDAAMEVLRSEATLVVPALPVQGRTTYCGYHFVNRRLLSESPLKDHPLNPMTDPDLVRWLQHQTERKVANAPLDEIRRGAESLAQFLQQARDKGVAYFVMDAVDGNDLRVIAQATSDWRLVSGGSGITSAVAEIMFPDASPRSFEERLGRCGPATLVVAGSCSPATRAQNMMAEEQGFETLFIEGADVLRGEVDEATLRTRAVQSLGAGRHVLISASENPDEVSAVQRFGAQMGLSPTETGAKIAGTLAEISAGIFKTGNVGRLLISGGETAAYVCRRLGFSAFEVGLPIQPGLPFCFPEERPELVVVLKSGNFGSADFYLRVASL